MRYRRGCQKSHQDNKIIFESETASLIVLNDSNRSKRDKERCNKQVRSDPVAFIKGGRRLTLRTSDGDSVSNRGYLFAVCKG